MDKQSKQQAPSNGYGLLELDDTSEPANNYTPVKKKSLRLAIIIAAVVIILLAAGGGGYWILTHKHAKPPQSSSNTTPVVTPTTTAPNPTAQTYTSNGNDLNLTFSYPADWTVTPPSNSNTNDQPITLTSPLTTITSAAGSSTTGKVVILIRPGSAELTELASGNATTPLSSVQFAYDKPTASQHQYPYLTFIHLVSGSNPNNGFEEVMITGVSSFTKGQALPAGSLGQLDPIISASFYSCSSETCTGSAAAPLSITNDTWQSQTVFTQVQSLFQSLQLH